MPTHVEVMCQIPSVALCEQIHSISKGRLGEFIRTCTDEEMEKIDNAIMISLGIKQKTRIQSTISNKERDDLVMKLEGAERMLDEEKALCKKLKLKLEMKEKDLDKKHENNTELITNQNSLNSNPSMIKVLTERDLYKELYYELLEKLRTV